MQRDEVACFWSSGKDSCLALYRARNSGYSIRYLINFISAEYQRVSFHGARAELVVAQANAINLKLLQRETTQKNYEEVFKNTLIELKQQNIDQVVRGDIHLQDLKDWVENACSQEHVGVISPLWHETPEGLLEEFISLGFKAVITGAQASKLDKSWIGRVIDKSFVSELKALGGVDLCGENGEYHSFVYDGPIFNQRIEITKTEVVRRNGFWFLDIQEYKPVAKEGK